MTTKDILIEARKLIDNPQNWTQRAWARSQEGLVVNSQSEEAVCWCAEGAIRKFSKDYWDRRNAERALARAFVGAPTPECPAKFNDTRTHAEVLAAFDKAIAAA